MPCELKAASWVKSEKGFKNVDNILKTSCSQDYIHKKKQGGVTYKDLFGNYLRTVKEICITAPFIRQPYQIRLKSQKSERISPFWVGGYPPFSALLCAYHASLMERNLH